MTTFVPTFVDQVRRVAPFINALDQIAGVEVGLEALGFGRAVEPGFLGGRPGVAPQYQFTVTVDREDQVHAGVVRDLQLDLEPTAGIALCSPKLVGLVDAVRIAAQCVHHGARHGRCSMRSRVPDEDVDTYRTLGYGEVLPWTPSRPPSNPPIRPTPPSAAPRRWLVVALGALARAITAVWGSGDKAVQDHRALPIDRSCLRRRTRLYGAGSARH